MTPAEIAARAAAVAAEWTPERIAKLDDDGVLDVRLRLDGLVAIQNLLADRERLRGLVKHDHYVTLHLASDYLPGQDGTAIVRSWASCRLCGRIAVHDWFVDRGFIRPEDAQAAQEAATNALRPIQEVHATAILDGGGAS